MRILLIGDIVGRPGREILRGGLRPLIDRLDVDFVIANVENAAAGNGLTREIGETILRAGVDVMTSGNHIWDRKEVIQYIAAEPRLLRPLNYPAGVPGRGVLVAGSRKGAAVGVINVMGRVFMAPLDDPFAAARHEAETCAAATRIIVVDFHAEATSEKAAMGWHLAGLVTSVIGTHTHVQTADERILPGGTAFMTDVGMTGPHESIIGTDTDATLRRFLSGMPERLEVASGSPKLQAVLVTADETSGRALAIERLSLSPTDIEDLGGVRG